MPGLVEMEEDIVISGISGRFPESASFKEFQENLFNHVNMVTVNERRFKPGLYGIPEGFGTLKEIDKFDTEFFKVLPNQVQRMDPQLRISLETTYEAMLDAGVNPSAERGTRTGVFYGVCIAEAGILWNMQPNRIEGATMTGCSHSMFANRISYAFDFKGPSCAYDTACSTSIFALEAAVSAIRSGKCDSAIVTASTLILSPHTNLQFHKLGMLAKDSTCKAFDQTGDGYVRAEAVATLYLQKASCARRNYASIIHVKTNTDGYKDGGITYPSSLMQEELISETYHEAGIHPDEVGYIEAHGTGTSVGDPQEVLALSKIFRTGTRTRPLLIGSVKSNMGHSEGASGVCGIAKILTILQTGMIPANLHYENPNFKMNTVRNGIIQVVDKNTKWGGGYLGLNSFGFGGVNCCVILKPQIDGGLKSLEKSIRRSPRIVTFSGRTEDGVINALKEVNRIQDPNMAYLLNEINKKNALGLNVRGFALWKAETVEISNDIQEPGPTWFVFNGMGSQWVGMGRSMMEIPPFRTSFLRSADTLKKTVKFDLMSLIQDCNEESFKQPVNCFVSIAAIQIAFVDTLAAIGIRPNGVVGHSAGELLCAYADECLNAEQTILAAYWRGKTLATINEGGEYGMAAVGLSWQETKKKLPEGIYAACHNGADSVTVSGPKNQIQEFVQMLKGKKKAATEVQSCGIAFHSPYIADASEKLRTVLKDIIKSPKIRSDNWISTSIPEKEWGSKLHSTLSADYIVNNFLSPVLFYEAMQKVPEKSTIIEIGPSGLLRGLIKRAAPTCNVIALQSRDSKDAAADFVSALGKLFLAQVNFDANKLTEKPMFPVPASTPSISPLVQWDHSTSWDVPVYGKNGEFAEGIFDVDMSDEADAFLTGHMVQGRVLFPATGYMVLVWKFFAQMYQTPFEQFPVVFEKVKFSRVTVLGTNAKIEFRVHISDVSGAFEIKEGGAVICSGFIHRYNDEMLEERMRQSDFKQLEEVEAEKLAAMKTPMLRSHIYKRLRFLGYEYAGLFKGIQKGDLEGSAHFVAWKRNWVSFLDTFLQTTLTCFGGKQTQTELPTEVGKLILNPEQFKELIANNEAVDDEISVFTKYIPDTGLVKCRGIEATGVKTTPVSSAHHKEPAPTLSTYSFTPYFDSDDHMPKHNPDEGLTPLLQCVSIVMENMGSRMTKEIPTIVEFSQSPPEAESLQISNTIRVNFAMPDIDYTIFSEDCPDQLINALARSRVIYKDFGALRNEPEWITRRFDVILLDNHLFLHMALDYMKKGSFLILKVAHGVISETRVLEKIGDKTHLVAKKHSDTHVVYLLRKDAKQTTKNITTLSISSQNLSWVPKLREMLIKHEEIEMKDERPPLIYLISNGAETEDSGLLGLILCLRKEPFTHQLRSIISKKEINLDFANPNPILSKILAHDLAVNILDDDEKWGYYMHAPINPKIKTSTDKAFVAMNIIGDLTTLNWVEGFDYKKLSSPTLAGHNLPVNVHFAALNFKDVMLASGNLQPEKRCLPYAIESPLGFEFSGVTEDGRRVFGWSEGQSLASQVFVSTDSLWNIPNNWSFEDAATVSAVYSTVYFALLMRGNMKQGESILIHAGAGGVGQAAIRLALSMNCEVFTTVGGKEKTSFIRKEFPQIPESHIASSRDTDFEMMVMSQTKGRGVDIVLNSLTGDKLEASVRCIARHGRFLEIGKMDLVGNKNLGMDLFLRDASFHGIMLDSLWDCRPETRLELKKLVQDGIEKGVIQPLPRRVYQTDQVEPAFRFMGQGRHIGKILIQVRPNEPSTSLNLSSSPRVYFNPNKSYIIIGGLGGFGLELANWMTTRYAKKLVLTTRTGIANAYQEQYINQWRNSGIEVKVLKLDASNMKDATTLVKEACALGPLGGFFNLAMQLRIGLMKTQTEDDFLYAIDPKVNLTRNIDSLTREMCPELDYFVVFSSVASGFGFDGQTNYGMANSALERICEKRVREGLPAKAIQWGPIGEVGAWHEEYNSDFQRQSFHGSGVQSIYSALKSMDILMNHPAPVMLSRRTIDVDMNGKLNQELSVMERIAHILGHSNLSKVNPKSKLTELGMDSVMAMEVKQVLEQDFALALSAAEIRGCTLEQLTDMSKNTEKMKTSVGAPKPRAATADLFQLNFMKSLSRSRFMHAQCVYSINTVTDKSNGTVFICNSIEGPDILRILGSLLTRPAYSMQIAEDVPMDNIHNMTDYYLRQLKATEPNGPYIIVGYSAGVFVAIELALRLQALEENKKLLLMDMTPARYDAIVEENFGSDRNNIDEIDLISVLFSQVFGLDKEVLERMLKSAADPESRIQKITALASQLFDEPMDVSIIQRFVASSGKKVMQLFDDYKPSNKYTGQAVLVRTTQNLISFDATEFWGLEDFCTQKPVVVTLDTTHSYMVAEPAVRDLAAAMNE